MTTPLWRTDPPTPAIEGRCGGPVPHSLTCTIAGGRISFGVSQGVDTVLIIFESDSQKNDIHYSLLFVRPDGEQLAEIGKIIDERGVCPVIDQMFPFDQAQEALRSLATGRAKGKVVVQRI
ncbi:zinc-binding dehydrogenase [Azospirillum griseum]|uniref:Zinc-binding dehydrogenase n=1 Tax=Azospirillum griseum TaxID=2496639 RepID=A0A431VIN1_9PROT|nr:zinc-binding dehydrogenase [Azospirillum griseum]RTR20970.1 hypothetical protein EJ903_09460 [Azospirillum griseum]